MPSLPPLAALEQPQPDLRNPNPTVTAAPRGHIALVVQLFFVLEGRIRPPVKAPVLHAPLDLTVLRVLQLQRPAPTAPSQINSMPPLQLSAQHVLLVFSVRVDNGLSVLVDPMLVPD